MNENECICKDCLHKDVCKYTETFEAASKNTKNKNKSENVDILKINISCDKFIKNPSFGTNIRIPNLDNITLNDFDYTSSTKYNPYKNCEDCLWYKNTILAGKTYVGDSPCLYCSKYPYKITCYSDLTGTANTATTCSETVNVRRPSEINKIETNNIN